MPSLNQDLLLFYYLLILHPYHSLPLPPLLSSHIRSERGRPPMVQQSMAYQAHPLRFSWTRQSRTRKVYSLCVSVCACMSFYVCITCTQVIKGIGGCRIPETGVIGSCEPPGVSAGNQIRGLCKNIKCSEPLNRLSVATSFSFYYFMYEFLHVHLCTSLV